jgi:signal transduction histidine kinase
VDRAVQGVKAHPEFHNIRIRISAEGSTEGWFDCKKIERVLLNLLLNACEAVSPESGKINVELKRQGENLEVRIADNGPGVAEAVRERLFEPFVSHGKENGTGMGLTVVQKILQDHGGDISVEQTSPSGTTFRACIPLRPSAENALAARRGN